MCIYQLLISISVLSILRMDLSLSLNKYTSAHYVLILMVTSLRNLCVCLQQYYQSATNHHKFKTNTKIYIIIIAIMSFSSQPFVPRFVTLWLLIGSLLVIWDISYVLNRPASMEGGPLFKYFKPYKMYIAIDQLYADLKDNFVVLQTYCNIMEVVLGMMCLILRNRFAGGILCIVVSSFTFWKTVIYLMYDTMGNELHLGRTSILADLFVFIVPTSFWIIMPILSIVSVAKRLNNNPMPAQAAPIKKII